MQRLTGAQAVADMLAGYGVTHVFMVPAILRQTLVEMERRTSIDRVACHGEKAAAYMADGYARVSGKPGICLAQHIGGLNLAAGLRDAWLAGAPLIAITGGNDPKTKYRKVYQEVDDLAAFDSITKWNAAVDSAERIPEMLRQAFRIAVTGNPGPVHLRFRGNEGQLDAEETHPDVTCEPQFARAPAWRPQPRVEDVDRALALLASAERPVFVAGGGARSSGAGEALVALAEALDVPVATSLNGKDLIPGVHPLSVGVVGTYSRESANRAVAAADLVCFVGTEAGGMTTHHWQVPRPGVRAVQIDVRPEVLGRHYPLAAAVLGDATSVLEAMLARCNPVKRPAWVAQCREFVREWYGKYSHLLESDAAPVRPERICAELTRLTPPDAVVVVDTGHGGMWMGGMFDVRSSGQSYIRSAGHLGWAFPAGIGAKAAAPDRPVVVFTGDAGFWYHIGELETAVRWGLASVTVINNNSSGNQSMRGFDRAYGGKQTDKARELWTFRPTDFAQVARAMGGIGIRVQHPREFADAYRQALKAAETERKPVVLDVVTDIEAVAPVAVTG